MTDRAVFILAAGDGKRWIGGGVGDWPSIPKQLLKIGDQTIIARTVGMVRQRGYEPIVVTHNPAIVEALPGVEILNPVGRRWIMETISSTRHLWKAINVFLWSDVIYSPAVMDAMLAETKSPKFFGTWGEGFGTVFRDDDTRLEHGLAVVLEDAGANANAPFPVGRTWELYRHFSGWDMHEHVGPTESNEFWELTPADDYTRDVDTPGNWEEVQREMARYLETETA